METSQAYGRPWTGYLISILDQALICKNHILYLIDDLHAQFLYSSAAACSALESTFLNQ